MNVARYLIRTLFILTVPFVCYPISTATFAAPAESKQKENNKVWALGELLLAEDFRSQADYSKNRVPLKNGWSLHANHAKTGWMKLLEEFNTVRASSVSLFENLPSQAWKRSGTAAGYHMDVTMLCGMIFGHVDHHFEILRSRLESTCTS